MSPSRQQKMERLIAEYSERGYQFACRLSGSAEEAKELVQEAFVRVFDNWEQYDPAQPFENWFMTILRNVYLKGVQSRERRRGVSLDAPMSGLGEPGMTFADALADPREEAALERLERQDAAEEVRAALESLSVEHKAILTLCDMQGLDYEEIAQVVGVPLGTVRSRINRARAAFKKAMLAGAREVEL